MGPVEARLRELMAQRILILDGAMGTMIQQYRLGEDDYRGERFRDHAHDVKGNTSCSRSPGRTSSRKSTSSTWPPART